MRLDPEDCRSRLAGARHAYLGTASRDAVPHLVPVTFAVDVDLIYIGIDDKPKSTRELKRLHNIRENPAVTLLADHYDETWLRLWWVRADGTADVIDDATHPTWTTATALLAERYWQYRGTHPKGPLIRIRVTRWTGWSYRQG